MSVGLVFPDETTRRNPPRRCQGIDWLSFPPNVTCANVMQMKTNKTIQSRVMIYCANERNDKFFQSQDRYQTNIYTNTPECEINLFGGSPCWLALPIQGRFKTSIDHYINRLRLKNKTKTKQNKHECPPSIKCWFMQRPRQNGRHFPNDIFKCIFLNDDEWIPIKISLKFVPKGLKNNIPALVQIMAWRRSGDKPLSEPMMV